MAILCLIGGIAASFLPETHGTELPETLDEAGTFGNDQKYFEWRRPEKDDKADSNDVQKV